MEATVAAFVLAPAVAGFGVNKLLVCLFPVYGGTASLICGASCFCLPHLLLSSPGTKPQSDSSGVRYTRLLDYFEDGVINGIISATSYTFGTCLILCAVTRMF